MTDLSQGLTAKQLALHPYCNDCGWRKGGLDSWDGARCKCGHVAPTFQQLFTVADRHEAKAEALDERDPDAEDYEHVGAAYHATRASQIRAFISDSPKAPQ